MKVRVTAAANPLAGSRWTASRQYKRGLLIYLAAGWLHRIAVSSFT
jgi:hypothetical protein